jgi:hypothetical protein
MVECLLAGSMSVHNGSVSVKELERAVSWRDERKLGAEVVAASSERERGGDAIVGAAPARAGHQTDVEGALEVSSFAFMH